MEKGIIYIYTIKKYICCTSEIYSKTNFQDVFY
jgi:hypothetical protein